MCYTHILSTYMFLGGMKLHHQITIIITISLYVYNSDIDCMFSLLYTYINCKYCTFVYLLILTIDISTNKCKIYYGVLFNFINWII